MDIDLPNLKMQIVEENADGSPEELDFKNPFNQGIFAAIDSLAERGYLAQATQPTDQANGDNLIYQGNLVYNPHHYVIIAIDVLQRGDYSCILQRDAQPDHTQLLKDLWTLVENLCASVNGDCYIGKDAEEDLVRNIRRIKRTIGDKP